MSVVIDPSRSPQEQPVELLAEPYYAWGNREPGGMAVWLRQKGR